MKYTDPTGEAIAVIPFIAPTVIAGAKAIGAWLASLFVVGAAATAVGVTLDAAIDDGKSESQEKSENQKAGNVKQQLESNAQATSPNPMPPDDDENKKKPSSQNQLQKQVERGQAPRDVDRVDKPHQKGQQPHVHFKDKTSLNQDGTVHDAHNGIPSPSNEVKNWLRNNGWNTGE